jgi:hypothetical protein
MHPHDRFRLSRGSRCLHAPPRSATRTVDLPLHELSIEQLLVHADALQDELDRRRKLLDEASGLLEEE